MKELSIEQKANAYDEAKARMSRAFNSNRCTISFMNEIFPELKESEDDRIKKEIQNFISWSIDRGNITKEQQEKTDSWFSWLEKQSKKVEPKFKVGDWIIGRVTNYEPRQISEITEQCYKSTYGGQYGFSFEDEMRLWTIQDAKDGDVLVASDGSIFIFAGVTDCACKYYVALTTDNVTKVDNISRHYWETAKAVHPATKEQRDALERAITNAGYEWNAKKKELKKIEDKSTWSEEDEQTLHDIILAVKDKSYVKNSEDCFDYDKRIKHHINWLKSLKERYTWKPTKGQIKGVEDAIEFLGCTKKVREDLKSLYEQLKKIK